MRSTCTPRRAGKRWLALALTVKTTNSFSHAYHAKGNRRPVRIAASGPPLANAAGNNADCYTVRARLFFHVPQQQRKTRKTNIAQRKRTTPA